MKGSGLLVASAEGRGMGGRLQVADNTQQANNKYHGWFPDGREKSCAGNWYVVGGPTALICLGLRGFQEFRLADYPK